MAAPSSGSQNLNLNPNHNRFANLPREDQDGTLSNEQIHPAPPPNEQARPPPPKNPFGWEMDSESESDDELPDAPPGNESVGAAPAPKPRGYKAVVEDMPENFKYREFEADKEHNPYISDVHGYDVTAVHKDYRKFDRPKSVGVNYHKAMTAQVLFMDRDKWVGKKPGTAGFLSFTSGDSDKLVKVSFASDSQMPAVQIHILKPGKAWNQTNCYIRYKVFANSLAPVDDPTSSTRPASISMNTFIGNAADAGSDSQMALAFKKHENLKMLAEKNNLIGVQMTLIKPGDTNLKGHQCRPIWNGLRTSELSAIIKKGDNEKATDPLSPYESAIYRLNTAENLCVFRQIATKEIAALTQFKSYFLGCMYLCATYRNFWFYQLQCRAGKGENPTESQYDIRRPQCNLDNLQPPRWLTTKWLTTAAAKDQPITEVEALNWGAFFESADYPSPEDCAFLVRLGLSRERASQKTDLRRMMDSTKSDHVARFTAIDSRPGYFLTKVRVPEITLGSTWETVQPSLDTRVKVEVELVGGNKLILSGNVTEDVHDEDGGDNMEDWDFTLALKGNEHTFGDKFIPIKLKLVDDPTTIDRARNCTEKLSTNQVNRDYGVDLRANIFACPTTIDPERQNSLVAELTQQQLHDAELRFKNIHTLNVGQNKAAMKTFTQPLTLIYGPPGTGKTTTVTAAAHEHVMLGRKVIYTCPSNRAADAAMTTFMKTMDKKVKAVRFIGGYKSPNDLQRLLQDKAGEGDAASKDALWDEIFMSTSELAAQANPDTLFHVQKQKALVKWSKEMNHPKHRDSIQYLAMKKKASQSGPERYKAARELEILDQDISDHFFRSEVDIVFTTCASSCHDSLNQFKPRLLILDEAGHATIPDACMACERFKESIESFVLSGDPNLLMPVVTAKTANESLHVIKKSLFDRMINDPSGRYDYEILTVHYRCHPDIISWASLQFYNTKLESHATTSKGNSLQRTVKLFFRHLNAAYNGRVRMGIDCSGPGAVSKPYANTQSFCNEEEARIVVGLIIKLLQFVPPSKDERGKPFRQVQPEDIGIITPYKGQRRLMRSMLQKDGLSTPWSQVPIKGSLSTTWGIQGSEVPIAFVSLCARDSTDATKKLRFIALPNALSVQNSRAKYFQVTTGNFRGWCTAINNDAPGQGIKHRALAAFRGLVKHHWQYNDIVSWRDIDDAFFSTPAKLPTSSYFRTTDVPSLVTENKKRPIQQPISYSQDIRKSAKKVSTADSTSKMSGLSLGKGGPSKRQLKKEAQKAKHQAAAAAAAAASAPPIEETFFVNEEHQTAPPAPSNDPDDSMDVGDKVLHDRTRQQSGSHPPETTMDWDELVTED